MLGEIQVLVLVVQSHEAVELVRVLVIRVMRVNMRGARAGLKKKRMKEKKPENTRSGDEMRRYWSGSCSLCSRYDGGSDIFMSNTTIGENPSKRPRSVIILPGEDNETRELDKDKHKEEMTYDDDDDYPSSRNNGSNDGLNNMEKRPIEDEKREDYAASNIEANEITESEKYSFEIRPDH